MNKKVKKKWLKALRSGKYKQTTGQLKRDNKFCCLGVLCDIHAKENNKRWNQKNTYHHNSGSLPIHVKKWAALNESNPRYKGKYVYLAAANDNRMSFKRIANIIEKNYKDL